MNIEEIRQLTNLNSDKGVKFPEHKDMRFFAHNEVVELTYNAALKLIEKQASVGYNTLVKKISVYTLDKEGYGSLEVVCDKLRKDGYNVEMKFELSTISDDCYRVLVITW